MCIRDRASDDPLSAGMVERWNAALPAGFSKASAEHIADGRGYSFAKLTYEKDVADILAKGETPAADMQARFDAVIDVYKRQPFASPGCFPYAA